MSHLDQRSYKCLVKEREKECSQNGQLETHRRILEVMRPYRCSVCEMDFSDSDTLGKHELNHQSLSLPYKCDVCTKDFSNTSELKTHGRIHQSMKPYKCCVCGMEYSNSLLLETHEGLHQGERSYECSYCKREFSNYSSRIIHENSIHQGVRPEKLITKRLLVKHIRNYHVKSASNFPQMKSKKVLDKKHKYSKHIKVCQKEAVKMGNRNVLNYNRNFEREAQAHSREPCETHESGYAEFQRNNYSEFSEEILIVWENISQRNEFGHNIICKKDEPSTDFEFSHNNCRNDNVGSELPITKQGKPRVPKCGEKQISEGRALKIESTNPSNREKNISNIVDLNNNNCSKSNGQTAENELHYKGGIYVKSVKTVDVTETVISSAKGNKISKAGRAKGKHECQLEMGPAEKTKATYCSRPNEQSKSVKSDYEALEQFAGSHGCLNANSEKFNCGKAKASLPQKSYSSIMNRKKYSSELYRPPILNSEGKPSFESVEERLTRPNRLDVLSLIANQNLDIVNAMYIESLVVNNWMRNMDG